MSRGLGGLQLAILTVLASASGPMTTDAIAYSCGARDDWRTDWWREEREESEWYPPERDAQPKRDTQLTKARLKWRSALSSTRRALATMQSAGLVQKESWRDGTDGHGQYPWAITEAGRNAIARRGGPNWHPHARPS